MCSDDFDLSAPPTVTDWERDACDSVEIDWQFGQLGSAESGWSFSESSCWMQSSFAGFAFQPWLDCFAADAMAIFEVATIHWPPISQNSPMLSDCLPPSCFWLR